MQEVKSKFDDLQSSGYETHFIGHLQTNTVKELLKQPAIRVMGSVPEMANQHFYVYVCIVFCYCFIVLRAPWELLVTRS